MDKKLLQVGDVELIAKDFETELAPIRQNILDALGVTRGLQETVQADNDAMANIELLKSTLETIKTTLESNGIEVTSCLVTDLSGYIDQLAAKVTELQQKITDAETQLEALV